MADGVTQDMLDSLEDAGLTGLALLADELRFPAASEAPLLGPGDFENLTFGVLASEVQTAGRDRARCPSGRDSVPAWPDEAQAMETSWPPYLRNDRERPCRSSPPTPCCGRAPPCSSPTPRS